MPSRTIAHMRIVCPSCSATYDVPDSLVTAGRTVRCARCHGDWVPVTASAAEMDVAAEPAAPLPEAVQPPDVADGPAQAAVAIARRSAMERLAASPALPKSPLPLWIAWALSALVIVAAVWAAYAWREPIIAAWPATARAYALFGVK